MLAPSKVRRVTLSGLSLSLGFGVSSALAQVPADVRDAIQAPPATQAGSGAPNGVPRSLAESLEGEAKRNYDLGRLLYDHRDYEGALAHFEAARQISGDDRLLWNAAICHKSMRQYAQAIQSMRAYLASSAPLPESSRTSARSFIAAAERLTARLEVSSEVSGATAFVDGQSMGGIPLGPEARLDWGTHQIVVKKPGYTDYEQTVIVDGPGEVRVAAVLRPIVHEGRVIVRAGNGDSIALDGELRAHSSWEGVLPSGTHWLRVSAPGFRAQDQRIIVTDAQTRGFDVHLQRAAAKALPGWVWLAGGAALAAGAATAGYFALKPSDAHKSFSGSIATVQLDLR